MSEEITQLYSRPRDREEKLDLVKSENDELKQINF